MHPYRSLLQIPAEAQSRVAGLGPHNSCHVRAGLGHDRLTGSLRPGTLHGRERGLIIDSPIFKAEPSRLTSPCSRSTSLPLDETSTLLVTPFIRHARQFAGRFDLEPMSGAPPPPPPPPPPPCIQQPGSSFVEGQPHGSTADCLCTRRQAHSSRLYSISRGHRRRVGRRCGRMLAPDVTRASICSSVTLYTSFLLVAGALACPLRPSVAPWTMQVSVVATIDCHGLQPSGPHSVAWCPLSHRFR